MTANIEGVLFDMGGTLRSTVKKSRAEKEQAVGKMLELLGAQIPAVEFYRTIKARAKAYKTWAEGTMVELNEQDLWTKWMLPDWPAEKIAPLAVQLNQLYRDALGTRILFPESGDVLITLYRRGYRLGLVSNTTSSVEVPEALREMQLAGCFEVVLLSAVVGKRKPDPAILLEAAERMGIAPEKCAYIGDRPDRDVAAARSAGFARAVILQAKRPLAVDHPDLLPDHRIANLRELLALFPQREPPQPMARYRASLSTMWALKNFPTLPDFFEFARRAGLQNIELNHQIDSSMLAGIDLEKYSFSSVHEPCPADISLPELTKRDWMISSEDEHKRREGVRAVQRSIDLARKLGASLIVVHAGHVPMETRYEKLLRDLILNGKRESPEYHDLVKHMRRLRAERAPAALAAVQESLRELLAYARDSGVRLGLENRYHYREIPSPDEVDILLNLAGPDQLGFWLDIGHAYHLENLGFYPHQVWLERFAPRIIGTHLHDVRGIFDHYAAGTGEVDFDHLAACLPADAVRTLEYNEMNPPEQLKASLQFLDAHGCIK